MKATQYRRLMRTCSTSLVSLATAATAAQTLADEEVSRRNNVLEEITVTAQKTEQSIMNVPISMTAFSAEDLEKYRVQKVEDFLLVTPGVQYMENSDLLKTVSIRGLNDSGGGLFQTAGVTIDDATLIQTYNGYLLTSRLFDVERVEILRGPQGTLSGSSSTSGTINIITKKPELGNFSGEGMLDYGRFDSSLLRAVANIPVSDTAAIRAVTYKEDSDGSLRNRGPAGGGSTEDHYGVRLALRWQPVEDLTLDASYNYERQKYGAPNALFLQDSSYTDPTVDGALWAETVRRNIGVIQRAGGSYDNYDFIKDEGLNGADFYSDIREKTDHELWFATLRGEYQLDRHSVSAQYTHYKHKIETLTDEDKTEFALLTSGFKGGPTSRYAEVRINSAYDGAVNWVAGISYAKERRIVDLRYDITDAFWPYYFGFGEEPAPDAVLNGPYYPDYWDRTLEQISSRALFGNVFWDISDRIHLSAGLRYSMVDTATQSQFDPNGNFGRFDDEVTASEDNIDPRIALNYDLSEDVTTYVQFATGYRPGYGNTGPAVELGIGPAEVGGETVRNYEIGLKGHFLDRRVTLATALFYMDYRDMQVYQEVTVDGSVGTVSFDDNVNSAEAKGFELEGDLRITEDLIVSGGVSYVKSTIDEVEEGGVIYQDVDFPRVGAWNVDLSVDYTHDLTDNLWGTVRADYSYRDGYENWFPWVDYGPLGTIPSYNTVNVSMGVHSEKWSAVAYMDNVFDEVYWQGTYLDYAPAAVVPYNARMFGIRLTARY